MRYKQEVYGVCPKSIEFDIEKNVITNIQFNGGCNGNLKAIAKLVDGWTVEEIEKYLLGNTCGNKQSSCADQLARVVRHAYECLK